jgi:hypothetical protein
VATFAQRPSSDAKDLLADIDHQGAGKVVQQLTGGDESAWNGVLRHIKTGSQDWLEVAQRLLPATDAGNTEDLHTALAVALTHNPNGVLTMVGPDLSIKDVCTVPFIEPDAKTVREHKLKVREALRGVRLPALSTKKRECLRAVAR